MSIPPLIHELETPITGATTLCGSIPLPIDDAARIAALVEIHPQHSHDSLITALLHYALQRIELPLDTSQIKTGDL